MDTESVESESYITWTYEEVRIDDEYPFELELVSGEEEYKD